MLPANSSALAQLQESIPEPHVRNSVGVVIELSVASVADLATLDDKVYEHYQANVRAEVSDPVADDVDLDDFDIDFDIEGNN